MGFYTKSAYGVINTTSNTYYTPGGYNLAGSVNKYENVSVLCCNGNWSYIEYNVANAQRKRAFILTSHINIYGSNELTHFYHEEEEISHPVYSNLTVYAGPNPETYPVIGEIYSSDNGNVFRYSISNIVFIDCYGREMYYVKYPVGNTYKYGYIYA